MTDAPDPSDLEPPEPTEELVRPRFRAPNWAAFIPILGLAVCAYLLAQSKDDLAYLVASSTPVDLGQPGAYHLELAQPGAFARITGEVHSEGNRFQEGHTFGKIWPLVGAPVLVERHDLDPLWGRVQVEGRLQVDDQLVTPFHKVIALFLQTDQLGLPARGEHVWLITQGRVPRGFDRTNAWLVSLMLLFVINAWLIVRPVLRR